MPVRSLRLAFSLAVALLFAVGYAQPLLLSLPRDQLSAGPGQVVTVVAQLENRGSTTLGATIAVRLPEGWRLLLEPAPVELAPGETRGVPLTLVVATLPEAGVHEVLLEARAGGPQASATLAVAIPELREVRVEVENAPETSLPRPYELRFRVSNAGNQAETVLLGAISSLGLALTPQPGSVRLEPGATALVSVMVPEIRDLERPEWHNVTLMATPASSASRAWVVARTQVVSTVPPNHLAYHTYPVTFGVEMAALANTLSGGSAGFTRFTASGEGELREDSGVIVAFDTAHEPKSGNGHLQVSLTTENRRLVVGDQGHGMGSILPAARGFGVGIATFFDGPPASVYGLVSDGSPIVGVNFGPIVGRDANLTARGEFGVGMALVSANLALSEAMPGGGRVSFAAEPALDVLSGTVGLYTSLRANGRGYSFGSELNVRQPGFNGQEEVPFRFSVAYQANIASNLRVGTRFEIDAREGRHSTYRSVAVSGSLGQFDWLARYYNDDHDLEIAIYNNSGVIFTGVYVDEAESTFGVSLAWNRRSISTLARPAEFLDIGLERRQAVENGGVTLDGGLTYDLVDMRIADARLGVEWSGTIGPYTTGELSMTHDLVGAPGVQFASVINHEFPGNVMLEADLGSRISADGRYSATAELAFDVPVSLRVARRPGVTEVQGWVRDGDGVGMPGLIVYLAGFTALTGEEGAFRFPAIPPGEHEFFIDGLQPDLVAVPQVPFRITAPYPERLLVTVYEAAAVRGRVNVVAPQSETTAEGVLEGASNRQVSAVGVRVVLSGTDMRRSTVVNPDGRFELDRLPPGEWSVEVDESTIPAGYEVAAPTTLVVTEPGRVTTIELMLQPVRRNIRFTGGGDLGCVATAPGEACALTPVPLEESPDSPE